jgi:hypothetical protein
MSCITVANSGGNSFSTLFGKLSGPTDLESLIRTL